MTKVTLLTQDDCTLCDHAKNVLIRVRADHPLEVQEIRLGSPEGRTLALQHAILFAPGVLLDGTLFSHGRLSEKKLRRRLERTAVATSLDGEQPTSRKAGAP